MKHILRVDGREIASGGQGEAIASVKLTRRVNGGEGFCFGSVCPAMLEISLLDLQSPIAVGEEMVLLDENRTPLGIFQCTDAEETGAVTKLTGYDSLYRLEKDVTDWLTSLQQFPYTLEEFAHLVCEECGITLSDDPIPNGGYPIEAFTGSTTARSLMGFVGEVAGCYLQADENGVAHFRWYQLRDICQPVCFTKKMQRFTVQPAHKVQIGKTEQDVGVIYPETDGTNTYRIVGNPLLTADVSGVIQYLFERLQSICYIPGEIQVNPDCGLQVGDIFRLDGQDFYVMQTVESPEGLALSCFGQATFDSVAVRNQEKFSALSGKVLELTAQVEGLKAENRDMAGNLAGVQLDLSGISAQVVAQSGENTRLSQSLTQLSQKADSISMAVSQVTQQGVSRVETAFGLTLDGSCLTIARQDSEITNRLNEKGMYVVRGEGSAGQTVMLQADADGVTATDVAVRNYLKIGEHARFEDYGTNRTACYYC